MAKVAPKSFEDLTRGTPFEGKSEEAVKNSLYGKALQQLRNENMERFQEIILGLYEAYGLTYRRRLSEAEKAEEQVRALLLAHPNLAAKYGQAVGVSETEPVAEPVVA